MTSRVRPTRRELLLAGAGSALPRQILAPPPAAAARYTNRSPQLVDLDRLHRLLAVEQLMVYCYEHVLSASVLRPRARRLVSPLLAHEQAHVRALSIQLTERGGAPPAPPAGIRQANRDLARRRVGGRLGQLQGGQDALYLLLTLEQVVVGAYFVALTKLSDQRLITLTAQMMAGDGQHAALVGEALYPGRTGDAVPSGLVQGSQ